jgi:hypothetical protein
MPAYRCGMPRPDHAVRRRRDAAVERTRSITKAVAVASVAAVAAFGIYISRAVPGHAATTSSSGSTVSPSGSSSGTTSSGSQSSGGLAPPASPPTQSQPQQQAPVVSGSS